MSDVMFTTSDDDVFWPPTDRTEAQATEMAAHPDAWAFTFLGSQVLSFIASADRVVVLRCPRMVDTWALGPRAAAGAVSFWSSIPTGWSPQSSAFRMAALTLIPAPASAVSTSGPSEAEDPPADAPSAVLDSPTVDAAVADIKNWLGLNDLQIEAATGVSRSTLWRSRTGRTEASAQTSAPIWRLHAFASALTRFLGSDGARSWLHAGEPSPAAALDTGDLAKAERLADAVLFPDRTVSQSFAGPADYDYEPEPLPQISPPRALRARRAQKAPRRPT